MNSPVIHRCRMLVRCLRMAKLLESTPNVPLARLARIYGVSQRTVRRDLAALAAANYRVPRQHREQDIAA